MGRRVKLATVSVAPGAAGLLILPAFLAGPIFFLSLGHLVPKLRNRHDPDLSSYQHSKPLLKQTSLSRVERAQ